MTIPLVDLKAQYKNIRPDVEEAMSRVLENTSFILGPEVKALEEEFALYCEAKHCIGVSSGTDAIHLVLRACNVVPGDEVITSPLTFIATAEAISMTGAKPVFADIDPRTFNIDPAAIEKAITPRTKALLPVFLYGQPADMDAINDIARRHDLRVIEDAAQAHGARYKGKRAGTLAEGACFSFYPGKNLGAYGDAGAVVTNDDAIAATVRMLRDHGRRDKYEHLVVGFGNRLDGLQGAILRAKLPYLEEWNRARAALAAQYTAELGDAVVTPYVPDWAEPSWHLYVIRVKNREAVQERLKAAGVASGVHYPIPLHLQPAYKWLGYEKGSFPNAEAAADEVLSLPIYPELAPDLIPKIARAVRG